MSSLPVTVIRPRKKFSESADLKELWQHRDLFIALTSRDLIIRYKQTLLGVVWVIFQPLMSTAVFTLLFGILIKVPSDSLPYPLFVFVGLVFWNFFANSLVQASGSLAGSESLIKKVYFPRIVIPVASILTNLVDLIISSVFAVLLLIAYRVTPHPLMLILFPVSVLLVMVTALGLGLYLSALNVKYRDVKQIVPFFIQLLIFLTPVVFPVSIVAESRRWILALNPMSTAITVNRSLLSGNLDINMGYFALSVLVAVVSLAGGLWYFSRTEGEFADVI